MPDPKGQHLYVNLSATQTRRRLKGFGHGVRKIHSAGRHQAVIIHTASGKHLAELEAKFVDVGYSDQENTLGEPIESLRNIGPGSAKWLRDARIQTIAELRRLGPLLAFQMVKSRQPKTSLNLLWALAAGLEERDWRDLTAAEKCNFSNQLD